MDFLNELEELKQHILTKKTTAKISKAQEGGIKHLYFYWQVNLSSPKEEFSTTVLIALPDRIDDKVEYDRVNQGMCHVLNTRFAITTDGDEDKNIADPEWIPAIR